MKFLLTIGLFFCLCSVSFIRPADKVNDTAVSQSYQDTTVLVGSVPVDFRFPGTPARGAILVLPGWNFSRTDLCRKSEFCSKAGNLGYAMVFPEMLKSVYASQLFPETRADWRRYPTMLWITDTLIPFCRNHYQIFIPGERNFLYGISTGARGVALVAENTGKIFMAGAALSGDYDQTTMPADRLMSGTYGPYTQFKDRWEGIDNPSLHSSQLKIPLYLAHGMHDGVVPYQQTIDFSRKIAAEDPKRGHVLHLCDTCGHNYAFWNSQTEDVLMFFEKCGHTK